MELEEAIKCRRDTRHFLKDPINQEIIDKAIRIADMAPSVGQLKPTRYILVESPELKVKIKENFLRTNLKAIQKIEKSKIKANYESLKLEAILEAPVGLVICCDLSVLKSFSIGTISKPKETLIYSTICAIHTLWLYLTSQELSMGWVSILNFEELTKDLSLNTKWTPMGYFCIGKPATNYQDMPMLSLQNWNSHLKEPTLIRK